MDRRIAFINPFGTAAFDEIIRETLVPYAARARRSTSSTSRACPPTSTTTTRSTSWSWRSSTRCAGSRSAGYDAVVVGCCYDPGVRVARELVDIPVVGPLEAAMNHASYVGHRFTIVTDHRKALPWLEDLVRLHGAGNCRGVRSIDWYVTDMIQDTTPWPTTPRRPACRRCARTPAEVVILGCTIIGGCLEREIMTTGRHRDLPILNPNLLALKAAESLADLHRMGKYQISRVGLYQRHEQHDAAAEADEVRRRWQPGRDRWRGPAGEPRRSR